MVPRQRVQFQSRPLARLRFLKAPFPQALKPQGSDGVVIGALRVLGFPGHAAPPSTYLVRSTLSGLTGRLCNGRARLPEARLDFLRGLGSRNVGTGSPRN